MSFLGNTTLAGGEDSNLDVKEACL